MMVEIMTKGRVSVVRGTDRYITVAVDECDDWSIKGVMFHCDDSQGILYGSMLEMILNMDRIFDSMGCPKQTFQMRHFPGTNPPDFVTRISKESERKGKRNTFRIYVQYRYHASWQGLIHWEEGDRQEPFESTLQLIFLMNQMLRRDFQMGQEGESLNSFHVAIDAYDSGQILGNYQNIPADLTERHEVMSDLAGTLGNFMKVKVLKEEIPKYGMQYGRLISDEVCSMCRRGGQKATFSIKIMFREHSTWQGIIYWREGRVEQPFRSFKEMLYLMVSAVGVPQESSGNLVEDVPPIALGS
jgi:hypothetical protein